MKHKKQTGFTLVELIVVMSVLVIISTVGFISYIGYLSSARDSNRITQITSIRDLLEVQKIKSLLPIPDDNVDMISNSEIIGYQGYAGESVLNVLDFTEGGKDPKDNTYFSYYLSSDRKTFQLMAFLEDNENLVAFDSVVNSVYAENIDYSNRYPTVSGDNIGILTDMNNTPIHELSGIVSVGEIDLSGTNSGTTYLSYLNNTNILENTGERLQYSLATNSSSIYKAPDDCPTGFISVPGNAEFSQKGFCVAKYEMTYLNGPGEPNSSSTTTDWNTYTYTGGLQIASKNDYPIADITQSEAIEACHGMGKGYHLITNNQWMTIARNIEQQEENWSTGITGSGFIWNGNSSGSTIGCSDSTGLRIYATKTGGDDSSNLGSERTTCNEKRQLLLSNGEIIWDLSGNVWEHVNKANNTSGIGYNNGQTTVTGTSTGIDWDDDGIYNIEDMKKYGSLFGLGMSAGVGNVKYSDGISNNIFIRGGRFLLENNVGIFSLTLGSDNTNEYGMTGFRCAKY